MPRSIRTLAVRWLLASMAILSLPILAADVAKAAADFVLMDEPVPIPERGVVAGRCVLADGSRFSFLPPPEWRVESNRSERSVTMTRRGYDSVLRFRLLAQDVDAKEDEKQDRWDRLIRERYPTAEVLKRFDCQTGSGVGVAFDLQEKHGKNLRLDSRVAFVTYGKGVVEVSQAAIPSEAAPTYQALGALLTSLRIEQPVAGK